MTIIDKYISDNSLSLTTLQMALKIGVCEATVRNRLKAIKVVEKEHLLGTNESMAHEMKALVELIEQRKTGWAVEVAKVRLNKLAAIRNY